MKDIRDISDGQMRVLYAEYRASIGRPLPAVTHRQGRTIPNTIAPVTDSLRSSADHALVVFGDYAPDGDA